MRWPVALGAEGGETGRGISGCTGDGAGPHLSDLRPAPYLAANVASRVPRSTGGRSDRLLASPAALRRPFRPSHAAGYPHDFGYRRSTGLPEPRPVRRLLSGAVWRVSIRNPATKFQRRAGRLASIIEFSELFQCDPHGVAINRPIFANSE